MLSQPSLITDMNVVSLLTVSISTKTRNYRLSINLTHIEAFNSTCRYLDELLNIDNPDFEGMVSQNYLVE